MDKHREKDLDQCFALAVKSVDPVMHSAGDIQVGNDSTRKEYADMIIDGTMWLIKLKQSIRKEL
jgi:hypothetical protein